MMQTQVSDSGTLNTVNDSMKLLSNLNFTWNKATEGTIAVLAIVDLMSYSKLLHTSPQKLSYVTVYYSGGPL